jgi:hypothetical protein
VKQFLWGALAMGFAVAGLFFARFWMLSRDRFFLFFSLAFFVFTANWIGLGIVNPGVETRHYFFILRLIAFLLIIAAVIDKNRASRRLNPPDGGRSET